MASSFETFKKVSKYHKIPEGDWKLNGQYNYIEFKNGSKIDLIDLNEAPSDPDFERYGSLEYTGGWIEEAGEVRHKCFDVLKSRIGRHLNKEYDLKGKLLCTANPTKNWLKRIFYRRWKDGTLPEHYAFIQSLYSDNEYTSKEYGENLNEIDDEITRQRLRDGNWEYGEGEDNLFKTDAISDLFTNTIDGGGDKYLVADIARFGSDRIVYTLWEGFKVYNIIVKNKQGINTTIQDIKELAISEKIPYSRILVDEDGVGGGVVDGLTGIKGFVGNSSALERKDKKRIQMVRNGSVISVRPKENYGNLRSQCYFMSADTVNNHEMTIINSDVKIQELIEEELVQIKRKLDDEKLRIISKVLIKEQLGRSPDFADALMMRMWFELDPLRDDSSEEEREEAEDRIWANRQRRGADALI